MPAPPPLILPADARKTIARVADDAAHTVEDRPIPGPAKMRVATALGMRRLKADGMPADLTRRLTAGLDPDDDDEPGDGLNEVERLIVDGISSTADAGVGVLAGRIEADTGCLCDTRILALIRSMLQVGIEVAAGAIKRAAS